MTRSLDDKLDEVAQKYDKDGDGKYDLIEVRAIVRDLLESNVEKRRFKRLALGLTALTALALTSLVVLGVVIISLLRDYDKEETDENLPVMQMNGNIVGTRAVTTAFPLLAATAMGMARLKQVKTVTVSILVFGELPSFLLEYKVLGLPSYGLVNQSYNVAGVTKISDTAVVFQTDVCGRAVVIADGAASLRVVGAEGNVTTARLCTSSLSCGAFQVESSEEEAQLMEKARGDLAASPSRRLQAEEGCFGPGDEEYTSTSYSCGDGEDTVCAEANKITDSCGADEACIKAKLCDHPNVCDTWKDVKCPSTGRRELFSDAEVEKVPRFDLDVARPSDALSKDDECADKPEELVASAAETLGLPADTCAELELQGACELPVVKNLCGKMCNECTYYSWHRQLSNVDKCT
mmetsp:Transcript_20029/g.64355  ORF Transcript_20029/g.64355 Transcript_20029/m.64355 type:complete len:407 (-) Transcript_20029:75-1295(-)